MAPPRISFRILEERSECHPWHHDPPKARVVFRVSGLLKKAHQEFERMKSFTQMQRGFQKGDKCQKGEKKNRRFCTTSMNIPKPWNRKNRLVPWCFQKIPKNPGDLRYQFRRDKFSPAWNLPKRCLKHPPFSWIFLAEKVGKQQTAVFFWGTP